MSFKQTYFIGNTWSGLPYPLLLVAVNNPYSLVLGLESQTYLLGNTTHTTLLLHYSHRTQIHVQKKSSTIIHDDAHTYHSSRIQSEYPAIAIYCTNFINVIIEQKLPLSEFSMPYLLILANLTQMPSFLPRWQV